MCGHYANMDFENEILTISLFNERQKDGKYPYSQVPAVVVGDSPVICQSGAIARYVAKLSGLYPSDPLKALYVDESYEVAEDLFAKSAFYSLPEAEKDVKRKEWMETSLPRLDKFISVRYDPSVSPFLANNEFSVADVYMYAVFFQHIATPLIGVSLEKIAELAPKAWEYLENLRNTKEIQSILPKSEKLYSLGLPL